MKKCVLTVASISLAIFLIAESKAQQVLPPTGQKALPNKTSKPPSLPKDSPEKKTRESTDLPVIVYLEKRDKLVTVKAGANGPVYFVKSKDGRTLMENLTEQELQAKAPEIYQFIKTAMGSSSPKDVKALDARIKPANQSRPSGRLKLSPVILDGSVR